MRFNDIGQIIVWLITGALAGFIVGQLVRRRGFGLLGNLIIGLLGALIGGLIFKVLNIQLNLPTLTFSLGDMLAAVIGALILLILVRGLRR